MVDLIFEGIDFVTCPLCEGHYQSLGTHIQKSTIKHNISLEEFKKKYPNIKITSEKYHKEKSKQNKGKNNPVYGNNLSHHKSDCPCSFCCAKRGEFKGEKNPSKRPKVREKLSESIKKSYTPELRKIRSQDSIKNGGWKPALEYLNKQSPFKFMGVGFQYSKQERDVCKFRFEKLGIIPISGINCHVYSDGNEFDFLQLGFVHEYHPEQQRNRIDKKGDYYKNRRKIMDNNGLKGYELIVTTTLTEAESLYSWLSEKLN